MAVCRQLSVRPIYQRCLTLIPLFEGKTYKLNRISQLNSQVFRVRQFIMVSCQILWHLICLVFWVSKCVLKHLAILAFFILICFDLKKLVGKVSIYNQWLNIWPDDWHIHNWQSGRTKPNLKLTEDDTDEDHRNV